MDDNAKLIAVFTAIGVLLGKLMDGGVSVINAWYVNRGKARAAQFSEQSQIIDRQERQIARLEAQIQEQQKAIAKIQGEHSKCREDYNRLELRMVMLREDFIRAGHQPREFPETPQHIEDDEVDFTARTREQATKLLVEDEKRGQSPGGDHANPLH